MSVDTPSASSSKSVATSRPRQSRHTNRGKEHHPNTPSESSGFIRVKEEPDVKPSPSLTSSAQGHAYIVAGEAIRLRQEAITAERDAKMEPVKLPWEDISPPSSVAPTADSAAWCDMPLHQPFLLTLPHGIAPVSGGEHSQGTKGSETGAGVLGRCVKVTDTNGKTRWMLQIRGCAFDINGLDAHMASLTEAVALEPSQAGSSERKMISLGRLRTRASVAYVGSVEEM
jgi:hypothetical protein